MEQDFPMAQMETIVVDDGSTDRTFKIAEEFLPRIRLIRKQNGGQVTALHAGIVHCTGDVIAFLDGDDWWPPNKIATIVKAFEKYPAVSAVGHGFYETDENGNLLGMKVPQTEYVLSFDTPANARLATRLRTFGGTSKLAVRRLALERMLPVPAELPFFDNYLFFSAIAHSGGVLLPEPLCYYRLHSGNLYASESQDESRLRRKYTLEHGLVTHLPKTLTKLGVSKEIIGAVLESDVISSGRLRLTLEGGKPWDTFKIERADFRSAYGSPGLGYKLFKCLVLAMTLLLPPKFFYFLRRWYAEHNLGRMRQRIVRAPTLASDALRQTAEGPERTLAD